MVSGTFGAASQIWCRSAVGRTYRVSGALPAEQVSPGHLHLYGSNLSLVQNKKTILTDGLFVLELLARFELATSSLPRMRSTG